MQQLIRSSKRRKTLLLVSLVAIFSVQATALAGADVAMPGPNWNAEMAHTAVTLAAENDPVPGWLRMIEEGRTEAVLATLINNAPNGSPAFESHIFRLASELAEVSLKLPVDGLLDWLADYQPTVLIAHEENAHYGVPLFAVNAAASGAQRYRQRRLGERRSSELLADKNSTRSAAWIKAYLAANDSQRQGFDNALRAASPASLQELAAELQRPDMHQAGLANAMGTIATSSADPELYLLALRIGPSRNSANLLREALRTLDASQRAELLHELLQSGEPAPAALGISLLAPSLRNDVEVSNTMLDLLADPELGSAAALALLGHPDPDVQARLQDLSSGDGLSARRAALALDSLVLESHVNNSITENNPPSEGQE